MRPILLGVTRNLHESRVSELRGVLNRATAIVFILVFVPAVLWGAHALGVIPSFFLRLLPASVVASVGAIEDTVDGASGFMADARHFLTTERALRGDSGRADEGDAAEISFGDGQGKAAGTVAWLGDTDAGTRLVLVRLDEARFDALPLADEALADEGRYRTVGYRLDPADGRPKSSQEPFALTLFEENLGSADWGDADPPPFEGAPVVVKTGDDEYAAVALLTQGGLVVKIPVEDLQRAGVGL